MKRDELLLKSLSEIEKVWLACAIDAEGCIGFRHNNGYKAPFISVVNSHRGWAEYAQFLTGGSFYIQEDKRGFQTIFKVEIHKRRMVSWVLGQILPYLIIKKDKAIAILEWQANQPLDQAEAGFKRWRDMTPELSQKIIGGLRQANSNRARIAFIPSNELLAGFYQEHGIRWITRKLHIHERRVYRLLKEYGIITRSKGGHVRVAGASEESIYRALALPYQKPEERG